MTISLDCWVAARLAGGGFSVGRGGGGHHTEWPTEQPTEMRGPALSGCWRRGLYAHRGGPSRSQWAGMGGPGHGSGGPAGSWDLG